ncbi:sensor histidine kinase [Anaerostipes sp.]|uniref:sensor histidine kinase n=1 Tax=Anaerostipes sp. TaxID=1872530 RepID=UPI0025C54CCC|nr:sensor histidine kinase [Anaerostipes sp.]MBS7009021.1 histidine kinase [Anaerostipes sp.]
MKKIKVQFSGSSLEKKLNWIRLCVLVPFFGMVLALLVMMVSFNEQYDTSVQNISQASEFNFQFREDIDYKMYRVVIGADTFEEMNPYVEIYKARMTLEQLRKTALKQESKNRLDQINRLLSSLEKYIQEIQKSDIMKDYKDNERILRHDVNIFTELIEKKISQYIYFETGNLKDLRSNLRKRIMTAVAVSAIISAFLTVLVWIFTNRIAKSISEPIVDLCNKTKLVGEGDFTVRALNSETEEVRILSKNFNQMVRRIEQLVEDVTKEQMNLRKTELELLQSQINPHFLYNTLDTIIWLAADGQNEQVVQIVQDLSTFFRECLSKGEGLIPIRNELLHVESYLKIQSIRYQDILDFSIDVPEEILDNKIIKMTLQPLVENALYHGIKQRREKGKIEINGVYDEDNIYLSVEDDGPGMDAEQVEKINSEMVSGSWERKVTGFGMSSVNQRLKLQFGEMYGLIVESEESAGTRIIVVLPREHD